MTPDPRTHYADPGSAARRFGIGVSRCGRHACEFAAGSSAT